MAKETVGKTVKQLKQERALAQTAFTKQANYLSRAADSMVKHELQEEFSKLSFLARRVSIANQEYRAGLLADIEAETYEGEEVKLNRHQQAELEKTMAECDTKLDKVSRAVQSNLWPRYGEDEVNFTIQEAEAACDRATAITAISRDSYEQHLELAKRLIRDAVTSLKDWKRWTPRDQIACIEGRVKALKEFGNNLEARRAEFLTTPRIAEQEKRGRESQLSAVSQLLVPQPEDRLKPIRLPTFTGCQKNFHRWRKEWESLQRQGETTGSAENKKFQLLDSVDERICRHLRLSEHHSAEDIFRVLQNKYGNKSTIALEIVEDLKRIPPLKSNQPKKLIDFIQAVEKAMNDFAEIERTGDIKDPLVIRSIESKLPGDMKTDWLTFMLNPTNNVTADTHFDSLFKYLKTQEAILKKLEQMKVSKQSERKTNARKGGCVVCGNETHREKIFFCKRFKKLHFDEKLNAVEKLGACRRCLMCHAQDDECTDTYLCWNRDCNRGGCSDHHFFLCLRGFNGKESKVPKPNTRRQTFTEEQEKLISPQTLTLTLPKP